MQDRDVHTSNLDVIFFERGMFEIKILFQKWDFILF